MQVPIAGGIFAVPVNLPRQTVEVTLIDAPGIKNPGTGALLSCLFPEAEVQLLTSTSSPTWIRPPVFTLQYTPRF
jgi:hypothetical protein